VPCAPKPGSVLLPQRYRLLLLLLPLLLLLLLLLLAAAVAGLWEARVMCAMVLLSVCWAAWQRD
jgi:hypothetical protein